MFAFILVCVIIGVVLAFFAAPLIMVGNNQKLNEMDKLIASFGMLSPDERQARRQEYLAKLMGIKSGIWSGDKQALEEARDKLSLLG
jgi:hypothetical protein